MAYIGFFARTVMLCKPTPVCLNAAMPAPSM